MGGGGIPVLSDILNAWGDVNKGASNVAENTVGSVVKDVAQPTADSVGSALAEGGSTLNSIAEPLARVVGTTMGGVVGGPLGAAAATALMDAGNTQAKGQPQNWGTTVRDAILAYAASNLMSGAGDGGPSGAPSQVPSNVFNTTPIVADPTLASTYQPSFTTNPGLEPGAPPLPTPTSIPVDQSQSIGAPAAGPPTPNYINPNPAVTPTSARVDPNLVVAPTPPPEAQPMTPTPAYQTPTVGSATGKVPMGTDAFTPKDYLKPPEQLPGYQLSDEKPFQEDYNLNPDAPSGGNMIQDLIRSAALLAKVFGQTADQSEGTPGVNYSWSKRGSVTPDNYDEMIGRLGENSKSAGMGAAGVADEGDPSSLAYALSKMGGYKNTSELNYGK